MIIITGASATGKTVTALELQKKYGLKKAITTTTRQKRINEQDGVDYFYLSKEQFEAKQKQGKFVETTLYNNNYYGCGIDQIDDNKVVVVDPNGLHAFLKLKDSHIVTFLLVCSDEIRNNRMKQRGDNIDKIAERMNNDKHDFSLEKIGKTDHIINTESLTIDEVTKLIFVKYQETLKSR